MRRILLALLLTLLLPIAAVGEVLAERDGFGFTVTLESVDANYRLSIRPDTDTPNFSETALHVEAVEDGTRLFVDIPYEGSVWPKRIALTHPMLKMLRFGVHPQRLRIVIDTVLPATFHFSSYRENTTTVIEFSATEMVLGSQASVSEHAAPIVETQIVNVSQAEPPAEAKRGEEPAAETSEPASVPIAVVAQEKAAESADAVLQKVETKEEPKIAVTPLQFPVAQSINGASRNTQAVENQPRKPERIRAFTVKADEIAVVMIKPNHTISRISASGILPERKSASPEKSRTLDEAPKQNETSPPLAYVPVTSVAPAFEPVRPKRLSSSQPFVQPEFEQTSSEQIIQRTWNWTDPALLLPLGMMLFAAIAIAIRYFPTREERPRRPALHRAEPISINRDPQLSAYYKLLGLTDAANEHEVDERYESLMRLYKHGMKAGTPEIQNSSRQNLRAAEEAYSMIKICRDGERSQQASK